MIKNPNILREILNDLKSTNPRIEDYCSPDFALMAAIKETLFKQQVCSEEGKKVLEFLVENSTTGNEFDIKWESLAEDIIEVFGEPNFSPDTFIYSYLNILFKGGQEFLNSFLDSFRQDILLNKEREESEVPKATERPPTYDRVTIEDYSKSAGFETEFCTPKEWTDLTLGILRQTGWSIPWLCSKSSFIRNYVVRDIASASNLMECPAEMFPYSVYRIDANEILGKASQTMSIDALVMNMLADVANINRENKILFIDNANTFSEAANGTLFMKIMHAAQNVMVNLIFGGNEAHPDSISHYVTNIDLDESNLSGMKEICEEACRVAKENIGVECSAFSDWIVENVGKYNSEDKVENMVRFVDFVASSFRNKKTDFSKIKPKEGQALSEAYADYMKVLQRKIFKVSKSHLEECFQNVFEKKNTENIDVDKAVANLDIFLKKVIFGQDEAIDKIHNTLIRSKANLRQRRGPLGVFLFLGASGTGKTFVAKKTQKAIYGDEKIIRLDMSEYADQTSVNKIFGASAGYVGYDDGSNFLKEVAEKPRSVILLDEIEKAHPQVLNAFLHIFDEGQAKTSKGEIIDFKDSIVIVTGNVGSSELQAKKKRTMAFSDSSTEEQFEASKKDEAIKAIKEHFRPEFLNRISDIVVFNNLTKKEIKFIVQAELSEIQKGCKTKGASFKFDESVVNFLVEKSVDPLHNGARLVSKIVRDNIETPLAVEVLKSHPKKIAAKAKGGKVEIIFSK